MQNNNGAGSGFSQLPIFNGVKYQFWSLKMKTLFKSQELWSYVEEGFEDDAPENPDLQLREKRKKDAKALFIIQQALDDEIFPRIASAATSKEAWDILKQEYLGDKKVMTVRLQSLRREFETALMKDKESVQDYLSRVSGVVQQMKSYGEKMSNQHVVGKVLRSLTSKYDHVVAAIEESKDMEEYTFEEMMGSLQAHEERLNRSTENKEENAFQVKEEALYKGKSKEDDSNKQRSSVQCKYCNKFGHKEDNCWHKGKPQCFKCKRFGHVQRNCRFDNENEPSMAQVTKEETLF